MKALLRTYLPFVLEYKKKFFFAFLGMIAFAIGTAGSAHLIKPMMDDIFIAKDTTMLALMPFLLIGVFSLKGVGKFIQTYYTSYIGGDVVRRLRDRVVSHLIGLDIGFFKQTHSGELLSRISNDIARIQTVVGQIIPEFFRELLVAIALTIYVIYASPKLAFYFLIIMPLALYPLSILARKMRRYSRLSQESTADMTSRLDEILSHIDIIQAYNAQSYEAKRFQSESAKLFRHSLKQVKTAALTPPLMELLASIAIGIVIYIGGNEVIEGRMSMGEFFAFATALFMLYNPIKNLSALYNLAQDAVSANIRMQELLQHQPLIQGGSDTFTQNIETITFDRVSFYHAKRRILSDISFEAKRSQHIALVGNSGAGKSSVVNLLMRFYDPQEGSIFINGKEIRSFQIDDLRKKIAYVSQDVHIFHDTIAANVAYGDTIDSERIVSALKQAYAWEFVSSMPQGIDTVLSQGGSNLSGGQRQRIALARALYRRPDVLILDEATSALDTKSEREILHTVSKLQSNMITFSIAHRLSTIRDADTILVFDQGKIISWGTHEQLISQCSTYRSLYKEDNSH